MTAPAPKKPEFVYRRKFRNTLPELPYDAKCLDIQLDPERFTRYQTTSLERLHRPRLHAPINLGLRLDLVDPKNFAVGGQLSEEDKLFLDALSGKAQKLYTTERPTHAHFLKTTYIGGSVAPISAPKPKEERPAVQRGEYFSSSFCLLLIAL